MEAHPAAAEQCNIPSSVTPFCSNSRRLAPEARLDTATGLLVPLFVLLVVRLSSTSIRLRTGSAGGGTSTMLSVHVQS